MKNIKNTVKEHTGHVEHHEKKLKLRIKDIDEVKESQHFIFES